MRVPRRGSLHLTCCGHAGQRVVEDGGAFVWTCLSDSTVFGRSFHKPETKISPSVGEAVMHYHASPFRMKRTAITDEPGARTQRASLSPLLERNMMYMRREDLSLNLNGVPDLIVTLMLIMFALVWKKVEEKAVTDIDVAQQTPQDYTGVYTEYGRILLVVMTS